MPSATQVAGARIAAATARGQTVVFRGPVMGGGAVTQAMKAHLAAGHAFVATESAAASFADDLDKVRALGARVVGDGAADEVLRRLPAGAAAEVASGDLDAAALAEALRLLGVEPAFAAVAVAVQDHGYAPGGSNRVLRFSLLGAAVEERRPIGDLFYDAAAVPPELTRLRAAADAAGGPRRRRAGARGRHRPCGALRGACRPASTTPCWSTSATATPSACSPSRAAWPACSSTTRRASTARASSGACAAGWPATCTSDEVRADHGHGAVLAAGAADRLGLPLIVTGPRRELLAGSELPRSSRRRTAT